MRRVDSLFIAIVLALTPAAVDARVPMEAGTANSLMPVASRPA